MNEDPPLSPYLLFLCAAIGFSWNGCALTFRSPLNLSGTQLLLATTNASICIGAIGLAFVDQHIAIGAAVVAAGFLIAQVCKPFSPLKWPLLLAIAALAIAMQSFAR